MPRETITIELKEQDFEDIRSAISFTRRSYPKDSPNFLRALGRIDKRLIRFQRAKRAKEKR